MPEIASHGGYLQCYNVPFIIYSPLLKDDKVIASVSSHLDVTPSVLSFLKESYRMNMPDTTHWLGDGLDTTSSYQNIHSIAFMRNSTEIPDYLSADYFLNEDVLYDISLGFDNKQKINSREIISHLKNKLANFRMINKYVCTSDKILDARSAALLKTDNNNIQLPVKTVFTFLENDDTSAFIVSRYELKNAISELFIHYSFNYKLNSTFTQNPSIIFELADMKGNVISKEEQIFNIGDNRKEKMWNGIPVDGTYSFRFRRRDNEKYFLSIRFKRKNKETGIINNFRIYARSL